MKTRYRLIASVAITSLLTSCFTGIESTPKITDKEVLRQQPQQRQEEKYFDGMSATNLSDKLYAGKQWIITDSKIRLIFDGSAGNLDFLPGDTLSFVATKNATTIDGRSVTDIVFTDKKNNHITYRTSIDPTRFAEGTPVEIPFTVDLDLINNLSGKMLGKQLYLLTRSRYDMSDNTYNGRRFVRVTIDSVSPGNNIYPIRLSLSEPGQKPFRLYMSSPFQSSMPRKFSTLFSIDDPRTAYPAISSEVWDMIIDGKVKVGMTRDECRLSLGDADNVDRQPGYSSVREIWTYKDGRYLIFIDGILESYRN